MLPVLSWAEQIGILSSALHFKNLTGAVAEQWGSPELTSWAECTTGVSGSASAGYRWVAAPCANCKVHFSSVIFTAFWNNIIQDPSPELLLYFHCLFLLWTNQCFKDPSFLFRTSSTRWAHPQSQAVSQLAQSLVWTVPWVSPWLNLTTDLSSGVWGCAEGGLQAFLSSALPYTARQQQSQ